jgi:diacylglycerol kinase family enzyme
MWAQPFKRAELEVVPPRQAEEDRVAVCVNANARKVTDKVLKRLLHAVREQDLFISRSELDARRIAKEIVERRYPTVFLGGGDGTFMGFVSEIMNQLGSRPGHLAPRFGVLKLGTGNAVASLVKASPIKNDGMLDDVLRARAGEGVTYREIDLLVVDGKRAPFAGLGLDGKVLNDYIALKQMLPPALFSKLGGAGGYAAAVALKTLPSLFMQPSKIEAEVVNGHAGVAYRLNADGRPRGEAIPPGGVLYKGPVMMAAAGTVPYYGYEMKMFPFAGKRRGMMNLRIGNVPTTSILANLPGLFSGTWFPDGIHDFHARDVTIKFARPMPLQVSGDAAGYRESLRLSVAQQPIELVDFTNAAA